MLTGFTLLAAQEASRGEIKEFDGATGTNIDPATGTSSSWAGTNAWRPDGVPTANDDVLFNNAHRATLQNVQLSGANQLANSVTISLTTNQPWRFGASSGTNAATLTLTSGDLTRTDTGNSMAHIIGATSNPPSGNIGPGIMTLATSAAGFTFTNHDTDGLLQIEAIVSGANKSLTKAGAGHITLTANNTYTGATTVSAGTLTAAGSASNKALGSTSSVAIERGGTLLYAADNQINASAPMTLGGASGTGPATFSLDGFSQDTANRLGALTLASNSIIDFGLGESILAFADSSGASWVPSMTLSIYNWTGTPGFGGGLDQLYFGSTNSSLTASQLDQFRFYSDGGSSFLGVGSFADNGEVVAAFSAVPEPSTALAAAALLALVGAGGGRRRTRSLRRNITSAV